MSYTIPMEIRKTEVYATWFFGLRDTMARARIDMRIKRLEAGNFGDDKASQERDIERAKSLAGDL